MRPKSNGGWMLPNLKTINRVPVSVTDISVRAKNMHTLPVYDKIWKYCNNYRLVRPGVMDEEPIFYINDEVGSAITHSDDPNVCMAPFIWIPDCDGEYKNARTITLMWAIKEIK